MTTFQSAEEALDAVLDLSSPGLSAELAELEGRLGELTALLDALSRLDKVNEAIQFSDGRQSALEALQEEPFGYSAEAAEIILDLPMSWQSGEQAEELRNERVQLAARRASLREHVAEVLALHWFG